MEAEDPILAALKRCPALEAKTLEGFLDGLLDEDLETLAQLPGTPGQVLAAQFTYYARSSVQLAEPLCRRLEPFQTLEDALQRLPSPGRSAKKRKAAAHADPSHPQAAAGA